MSHRHPRKFRRRSGTESSTTAATSAAAAETAATETTEAAAASTESASTVDIVNDYNNTEELLAKFPVENPTAVTSDLEKNIQNRLLPALRTGTAASTPGRPGATFSTPMTPSNTCTA